MKQSRWFDGDSMRGRVWKQVLLHNNAVEAIASLVNLWKRLDLPMLPKDRCVVVHIFTKRSSM